jgi:LDH2 family malate/lactate/ureidoglycolate dehydrogenase
MSAYPRWGPPFIVDMVISMANRAKICNTMKRGEPILGNWAADIESMSYDRSGDGARQRGTGLALLYYWTCWLACCRVVPT